MDAPGETKSALPVPPQAAPLALSPARLWPGVDCGAVGVSDEAPGGPQAAA